jgi:predicted AlkP superfamily phosphohydrolase/phosphomutase
MNTLLIGLDGATFSICDPLIEEGVMPFLKGFVASGTRAELLSTPNPLTPPAWTSLITGRSPGQHGIFDFIRPEETGDGVYMKLVDSRDIGCETIWSMASRQNRGVISLNFPVMFPPKPLAGYMIPGFVSWRHLRRAVYPPDLYEELKVLPGFNAKEIGWDMYMERKAIQSMPHEDHEDWIRFHIRREEQWFEISRYLMRHSPCDLTAILFDGMDKLQHLSWPLIDPSLLPMTISAWQQKIRALCLDYFRKLDGFLSDLISIAGRDARVFMVSDHGFGPTWDIFYLNVWLHQQGLLQWGEGGVPMDESEEMFVKRMKTQLFDWRSTVAYAPTPSSNGVHIRVSKGPGCPGIPPEDYERFRSKLIASLLAFTDPESGEPIVKRVMTREEVFSGSQMHRAPDLTLVLRDQGFISILNADSPLKRRKEPKGMHRPEGIFIASGPGIRSSQTQRQLSILDVCPALLYSLGLAIPQDLEGRFPAEVFEPCFLETHPPRIGDVTIPVHPVAAQPGDNSSSEEEEAAVLSRLRALGYIE